MEEFHIIKEGGREHITPLTARQKLCCLIACVYVLYLFYAAVCGGAFLDALLRGQL